MAKKVAFREVIRPPLWLIAFIYFMLFSLVLAIWAAFDNQIAGISALLALFLGAVAVWKLRSEITYDGEELRVKRAHIQSRYIGESTVVNRSEFSAARTRYADPAAYFALTFWVSQGLRIEVKDERDTTPYWLISMKRADELKQLLDNKA